MRDVLEAPEGYTTRGWHETLQRHLEVSVSREPTLEERYARLLPCSACAARVWEACYHRNYDGVVIVHTYLCSARYSMARELIGDGVGLVAEELWALLPPVSRRRRWAARVARFLLLPMKRWARG